MKIRPAIFIVFFALQFTVAWSDSYIDSLKHLMDISGKEEKPEILNKLSEAFRDYIPDESYLYALRALEISRINQQWNGEANALKNIGVYWAVKNDYKQSIDNLDSALEIFNQHNDPEGQSKILNALGRVFSFKGQFEESIKYLQQAIQIQKDNKDKYGLASTYLNLGIAFHELGDLAGAIDYYNRSMIISKEIKNNIFIARSLYNIGSLYLEMDSINKAIEYYQEGMPFTLSVDNKEDECNIYCNLSCAFLEQKDYNKALDYQDLSLSLAKETGNKDAIATSYLNYGKIFLKLGKYDGAKNYLNLAIDLSREIGNESIENDAYQDLALLNMDMKQYDTAIKMFESCLMFYRNGNIEKKVKETYKLMSQVYSYMGNTREEYKYYKLYSDYSDTINNRNYLRLLSAVQLKVTTENELEISKRGNEIKELKLSRLTDISLLGGIILLIISTVTVLLIRMNKKLKVVNLELKDSLDLQNRVHDILANDIRDSIFPLVAYIDKINTDVPEEKELVKSYDHFSNTFNFLMSQFKHEKN